MIAAVAALALTGCAHEQPPVSQKVQDYYDAHVANAVPTLTTPPTAAPAPTVAFIGDSYSAYSGTWTLKLATAEKWQPKVFALGGTGYVKSIPSGGVQACGQDVCGDYLAQAAGVIAFKPDVVVISGGRNDLGEDPAAVKANAAKLFTKLSTGLPKAKLIVTSPVWDATLLPDGFADLVAAVKAAATDAGVRYVDIGQPLAGKPGLVGPDGVHPTSEGHAAIAAAVSKALG